MNWAVAIRRGLPSTLSEKSCEVRSANGRPDRSRTLTSTGTRSTDDLKVGFGCGSCGAVCAAADTTHMARDNAARSNFIGDLTPPTNTEEQARPQKNTE